MAGPRPDDCSRDAWRRVRAQHGQPENVIDLFQAVGVEPFLNVSWKNMSTASAKKRVSRLVEDRGTVVHTGELPVRYGLPQARKHREFILRLVPKVDATVADQLDLLAGKPAW